MRRFVSLFTVAMFLTAAQGCLIAPRQHFEYYERDKAKKAAPVTTDTFDASKPAR